MRVSGYERYGGLSERPSGDCWSAGCGRPDRLRQIRSFAAQYRRRQEVGHREIRGHGLRTSLSPFALHRLTVDLRSAHTLQTKYLDFKEIFEKAYKEGDFERCKRLLLSLIEKIKLFNLLYVHLDLKEHNLCIIPDPTSDTGSSDEVIIIDYGQAVPVGTPLDLYGM